MKGSEVMKLNGKHVIICSVFFFLLFIFNYGVIPNKTVSTLSLVTGLTVASIICSVVLNFIITLFRKLFQKI